jgi:hypothetical protein
MNAYDFSVNYLAALVFLQGGNPYDGIPYRYPMGMMPIWAIMALFGREAMPLMFILWGAFNVGLLIWAYKTRFWQWIFYFPVIHELSSGQIELLLWVMASRIRGGWSGAFLAAFISLKPQSAIILLPYHLWRWLRHDRATLWKFPLACLAVWGWPFLVYPTWFSDWLAGLNVTSAPPIYSAANTTGLFSILRALGVPLYPPYDAATLLPVALLGGLGLLALLWALRQNDEAMTRAAALLANPLGLIYTQLTLMGGAPWWLLVPLSWAALFASLSLGHFVPYMSVPLAIIAWGWWQKRRSIATSDTA